MSNLKSNFREYLAGFGFPITKFEEITEDKANDFVFVIGATVDYLPVTMDAIGKVQDFFPNHLIIYVDLGPQMLSDDQISKVCRYVAIK